MHIFMEIGPLKAYLKECRSAHSTIGFVPTMGALHAGHLSLIKASKRENTTTIASIYINPAQFNNAQDLAKYPRVMEKDIQLLKEAGCDALFCPSNEEMYPEGDKLKFDFGSMDKILEGEFRPGHFSGVALVVIKLFNIVQPDSVFLGQKDFQQFIIISKVVADLKFDMRLICAPIVREEDGLAMSSRNMRLTPDERKRASVLHECLQLAKHGLMKGNPFKHIQEEVRKLCEAKHVKLEYLALADRNTFQRIENLSEPGKAILLIAAYVGEIRLIDNIFIEKK